VSEPIFAIHNSPPSGLTHVPEKPGTGVDAGECVLVAAGKRFFAEAIRSLLEEEGLRVVGVVTNSADAVQAALERAPDVVLMDLDLPEMEGLHAGRRILRDNARTKLVGLINEGSAAVLRSAKAAGFVGCLPKGASPSDFIRSVRAAVSGRPLADCSRAGERIQARGASILGALTPRERQVLAQVIEGHSSREIGEILGISQHTVRSHVQNVLDKLGVASRLEAASLALRQGLREQL
jgi:DNA-binding NarL/FixJ family response regulator